MIEPDQAVELLNVGTESADISGWYIDDSGGTTFYTIPQNSILYSNACLVFSGSFNLNKTSSDSIRLFNSNFAPTDSNAVLVDSFSYSSSPGQNISYSRIPDASDNWATASASLNQFNESGQSCLVVPTSTPTPTLVPSPQTPPAPTTPPSYTNVYISEVLVNPPSGEKEWLEIYNANDFSMELINWYIDDIEDAGSQPYLFSLTIHSKEYKVIELPASIFNNSSDFVRLLDSSKNPKDSIEYTYSEKEKTWGRVSFENNNVCLQEPSRGSVNNPCIEIESNEDSEEQEEDENVTSIVSGALTTLQPTSQIVGSAQPSAAPQGTVLGESVIEPQKTSDNLHKFLSFLSISYSTLTIFSLLFKIKFSA